MVKERSGKVKKILGVAVLLVVIIASVIGCSTQHPSPSPEQAPYEISIRGYKLIYAPSYKIEGGVVILDNGYWILERSMGGRWVYHDGITVLPTDSPITITERT